MPYATKDSLNLACTSNGLQGTRSGKDKHSSHTEQHLTQDEFPFNLTVTL
jgi:hypothetical protein